MRQKRRAVYHKFVIVFLCIGYVLAGCRQKTQFEEVSLSGEEADSGDSVENADQGEEPALQDEKSPVIFVYVCGAVEHPGVYEMEEGDRVYQVIRAAGGVKKEADGEYLNQAELLEDGQKVYVPTKEETASMNREQPDGVSGDAGKGGDGKVNLNTATLQELMTLSGIGESRAEAILRYREKNGGFQNIEEIKNIEGIKEGIFEKIKDDIIVN